MLLFEHNTQLSLLYTLYYQVDDKAQREQGQAGTEPR